MTTEREAFEDWARSKEGGSQSCSYIGGHDTSRTYVSYATEEQLNAWQASRKVALEDAAKEADEYLSATYGASYGVGKFIRSYLK
jgi:hypothetical protein